MAERFLQLLLLRIVMAIGGVGVVVGRASGGVGRGSGGVGRGNGRVGRGSGGEGRGDRGGGMEGGPGDDGVSSPGEISFIEIDGRRNFAGKNVKTFRNATFCFVLDNSVADSGSPDLSESSSPERNDSTSVNVPPKYGGELAEYLKTHSHEEIMQRLKHVQLGDRTKYRLVRY